jgi:hypothetical protein
MTYSGQFWRIRQLPYVLSLELCGRWNYVCCASVAASPPQSAGLRLDDAKIANYLC